MFFSFFPLCLHRLKLWSFCFCLLSYYRVVCSSAVDILFIYTIFFYFQRDIPIFNELILQGTFPILSRNGITAICSDSQPLVIWYDRHFKEDKLAKHHCYWEVNLHVRAHVPLVRKHIQRYSKVSFSFITEHKLSVPWLPFNRWYHSIFWIKTAKLYFYFTNTCHRILNSYRNFQYCVGIDDSRGGEGACCVAASQRCCEWEVGACFYSFAIFSL